MNRIAAKLSWIGLAMAVCVAGAAVSLVWHFSGFTSRIRIADLEHVPIRGHVRVIGTLTYVDAPGRRFWLQDETGALFVDADPVSLPAGVGQSVAVEAVKSASYDPARGPQSVELADVRVKSAGRLVHLPTPQPILLNQFPSTEKNGIQVQASGVLRNVAIDKFGQTELQLGTANAQIPVTVPGTPQDYRNLVNADLQILGVPETTRGPQGIPLQKIWVSAQGNVRLVRSGPSSGLHTVRSLYQDAEVRTGHLVRVRGVVAESGKGELLLEDAWGTVMCKMADVLKTANVGKPAEIEGFPMWDGIRLDLVNATVRELPAGPTPEEDGTRSETPIATVRAIRNLSASQAAQTLPVRLHGVLTYVDPIWRQLYIRDDTGGVYVKFSGTPSLSAGMRVTLTGITGPGDFAPVVLAPKFAIEGTGPLPRAIPAEPAQAAGGLLDSQFVSIDGVVHPMKLAEDPDHPIFTFELLSSIGQVHVYTSPMFSKLSNGAEFEDARVRIRGVFGTIFNNRRQLIGYQLLVNTPDQIEVLDPPVSNPYTLPATAIADLLRFSPKARYGHRVKIAGVVTFIGRDFLYVQDSTAGVEIRGNPGTAQVGDQIEVVGYPTLAGRYSPVVTDATFRLKTHGVDAPAKNTTAESILNGNNDSMLVSVEGKLVTKLEEPSRVTLIVQSGIRSFSAQLDLADRGQALADLETGSIVRVNGICVSQVSPDKVYAVLHRNPDGFQLLLRTPQDVAVVRGAPVWTLRFALILLGLAALLMATILAWVAVLGRRIRLQREALRRAEETALAVRDLSTSMQNVAREQRFDAEVSVRGSEDIAQLVVGFNQMLAELRVREEAKRVAEQKLQNMAMFDELTGLANRRMLFESLNQSLARARREDHKLALLYIDLDGFKLVNDNLGHNIGDLLLEQVARRLRGRIRSSDVLARIGGDEFTLILSRVNNVADAETAAHGLVEALEKPFEVNGHAIRIGASIGISLFPDHANECGQLVQQADCAMYAAKHNGKNRIVHFGDDLGNAARVRITLESELRKAVAEHAITLHYQPEFDLKSSEIVRFEALARWHHPTLGAISPLQFIPIAEETGLIVPLGAQILEKACRSALEWNAIAGRDIPVAVNVSTVQFARDAFVEEIAEVLKRTGLSPRLLQIELTESATLSHVERSVDVMSRLKELGITLAIDDFGTGYSCLSYLPRLPFDAIKIDRSFVVELTANPDSSPFTQSVLSMAHKLGMRAIVEGIESQEELEAVRSLGADEAQGYLLGRPSPDALRHLRPGSKNFAEGVEDGVEPRTEEEATEPA